MEKEKGQSIRRSQFITTYGPGAILEGPNGPRIIPALDSSNIFGKHSVSKFEVTYLRLSSALLNGAGVVRLPSNAELRVPDSVPVYETIAFPSWALCPEHNVLYRPNNAAKERACPLCPPYDDNHLAAQRVRQQAIRFVRACLNGHLDDVDWLKIITHKNESCQPNYLNWIGSGKSLRNIDIECPDCGEGINLGQAYSRDWPCSGRFPERDIYEPCTPIARIIQRGAASLRMAELHSALTIPPADTELHRRLETHLIKSVLITHHPIRSKQQVKQILTPLVPNLLARHNFEQLLSYSENEILNALDDILPSTLPQDRQTLRKQEFEALRQAATKGASAPPGKPPQFQVIQSDVREIVGQGGHRLRVTPVSKLRVVMVQRGYRRLDPLNGELIEVPYVDENGGKWYPGVELFGEGVFVDFVPSTKDKDKEEFFHFRLKESQTYQTWMAAWHEPEKYQQELQNPDDKVYLHPVFVWWHTLAHRLINALSIDSGYSSAALRERVYIDIDEQSTQAVGGILLYTIQPGGDGTLGGLIAQVPRFEHVLKRALHTIDTCSNDPLCAERQFFRNGSRYNGAACYACQLVSETSCEHRNTRLDRTLLRENKP